MSGEWIKDWFRDCADEVCATLDGGAVVVIAKVNPMAELTPEATGEAAALIASAPALVEALKPFARAFECFDATRWDDETRITIELPTTKRARPVTGIYVEDVKRIFAALKAAGVSL